MVQITTTVEAPAVQFSINFKPSLNALGRRVLQGGGAVFITALDTPAVAIAVRTSLLTNLVQAASPGAKVVLDQVLVASAAYDGTPQVYVTYNDSSPVNTAGNTAASIDDLIESLTSSGAVFRVNTSNTRRRAMAFGGGGARRRRLELTLQPLKPTWAAGANATYATSLAFNIIAINPAAALTMSDLLKGSTSGGELARDMSQVATNASGVQLDAEVDTSSVKLVTLTYKKSRWALFLEWLKAQILRIIACGVALIVCFCILVQVQRRKKARERQRKGAARAKAERLEVERAQKALKKTAAKVDRARWRRVRISLLHYLRASALSKAALGANELVERARERAVVRTMARVAKGAETSGLRPLPHPRGEGDPGAPHARSPRTRAHAHAGAGTAVTTGDGGGGSGGGGVPHGGKGRRPRVDAGSPSPGAAAASGGPKRRGNNPRQPHEKEPTSNPHTMPTHTSIERTEDVWATATSGTQGSLGEDFAAAGALSAAAAASPLSPSGALRGRRRGSPAHHAGGRLPGAADE
jgi:hypothetical protein